MAAVRFGKYAAGIDELMTQLYRSDYGNKRDGDFGVILFTTTEWSNDHFILFNFKRMIIYFNIKQIFASIVSNQNNNAYFATSERD